MKTPKILRYVREERISLHTLEDLQITKILSGKAIEVLSHPCGGEQIRLRQQVFRDLSDVEKGKTVSDCYEAMRDYSRALRLFENSAVRIEKIFLLSLLMREFLNMSHQMRFLINCSPLLADLASFYSSNEWKEAVERIKNCKNSADELLGEIGCFALSFGRPQSEGRNIITQIALPDNYYSRIVKVGEKLGFDIPQRKPRPLSMEESLSDIVLDYHREPYEKLMKLYSVFDGFDWKAPLSFKEDIEFFYEIVDLQKRCNAIGVSYCYPKESTERKYNAKNICDITLLAKKCEYIVPNDVEFDEDNSFCFLVGANGGGKTTYVRALGVNLILFLSGCPIFAEEAEIYPFSSVITHFPKDERFSSSGRLDEERARVKEMMTEENKNAFLLFNETFSGTDEERGYIYAVETAQNARKIGNFALFVTHFHKVSEHSFQVLRTMLTKGEDNEHIRTYRIKRADGVRSSYAVDVLRKYGLDKDSLIRRCAIKNCMVGE